MSRRRALIGSSILILSIIGAGIFYLNAFKNAAPTSTESTFSADASVIASRLNTPWSVAFYNKTALISSRNTGEILELLKDGDTRVVTTLKEAVHTGEGGLLGLAVSNEDYLYAYLTTSKDNRIVRMAIDGEPGSLSLGEPGVILSGLPSASTHNGGRIAFGPDRMLYATVGDAGNPDAAQDKNKLHGKILRMTPTGNVPEDNPIPDSLVYSYGHRNPQGIAWSDDGTMYASEFGQNTWDELNIIRPGANYGWPEVEGRTECPWNADCAYEGPVQKWATKDASPSGIAYADETIFIANLRGAVLRAVPTSEPSSATTHFRGELGRIRDVVVAPDGKLWIVTNNTDGRGRPGENDDRIIAVPIEDIQ